MDSTDKLIQNQFDALPAEVKEAVSRIPWKERVQSIAKREGLDAVRASSLETETMLVLYGFVPADSYLENIMTELGVGDEQAERIEKLVIDEIFSDIEKQYEMIEALMPATDNTPPAPEKPKVEIESNKGTSIGISPEILAKSITLPEIAPDMLPKTVPGEVAHDVPPPAPQVPQPEVASPAADVLTPTPEPVVPPAPKSLIEEKLSQVTSAATQVPAVSYPSGKDPYREPLE